MHFEPIRPISVVDLVVHRLEEMMLQGALRPGERLLPERDLAQAMAVSRTSIRQALAVLKDRGLISVRAGAGSYAQNTHDMVITDLAGSLGSFKERVLEPMEVRQLLEPQTARLAAERASDKDIADIESLLASQRVLHDCGKTFVEEDIAFHRLIATSANNKILLQVIDNVQLMLRDSRELSLATPAGARASLKGHNQIYEAIRNRQPDRAFEAMAVHIETVSNLILARLTQEPAKASTIPDSRH